MSEPEWQRQQRETFIKWMNNKLKKAPGSPKISRLEDLQDGVILCVLFESLFPQTKMPRYNKNPKLPAHKLDNLSVAFNFMEKAGIKTFCKPQNVLETDHTMVMGLMWTLILEFDINRAMKAAAAQKGVNANQHAFDFKPGAAKDNLLGWTQAHVQPYGQDPQNFNRDFNDGEALLALVHSLRPDTFKYDEAPHGDSKRSIVQAMTIADKEMGIDPLLDPDTLAAGQADEKSVMAYVVQFLDYENNNAAKIQQVRSECGEEARQKQENRLRQTQETREKLSREAQAMEAERRALQEKRDAEERRQQEELDRQQAELDAQRRALEEERAAEEARQKAAAAAQQAELDRQRQELEQQRKEMEEMRRKEAELEKSKMAKKKKELQEQRKQIEEQKRRMAELEESNKAEEQRKLKEVEAQKKKLAALQKQKEELARQQRELKEAEEARKAVLLKQQELLRKKAALEEERKALQKQTKTVVPLNMAKEVTRMSFFQSLAERQTRDYVLFVDKSGSMKGTRWDEARKAVEALAPQVTRACPLGISLYFFNDECVRIDQVTTSQQVAGFFQKEVPDRGTNLHLAFKHAFGVHHKAKRGLQPETWLVITDGSPDKPTHVYQLLKEEYKTFKKPDEVTISFIQIGDDEKATDYLQKMRGSLPFVDTLTSQDLPTREEGFSSLFTTK